jgi:hypothetical protein
MYLRKVSLLIAHDPSCDSITILKSNLENSADVPTNSFHFIDSKQSFDIETSLVLQDEADAIGIPEFKKTESIDGVDYFQASFYQNAERNKHELKVAI